MSDKLPVNQSFFLCVIRDEKHGYFERPFCIDNLSAAKRGFTDALLNIDHPYSKHPHDYTLYSVGSVSFTFDDSDGFLPKLEMNLLELFSGKKDFDELFEAHLHSEKQLLFLEEKSL